MDRVIDITSRDVFLATQHMKSGGRVIMISSSVNEYVLVPGLVAYSATKGCEDIYSGALRRAREPVITVNNVQPGPIDTELDPAASEWAANRFIVPDGKRFGLTRILSFPKPN
jgi:3-oxoacyl-[acyl-carrier protein] reductase